MQTLKKVPKVTKLCPQFTLRRFNASIKSANFSESAFFQLQNNVFVLLI